jgi:hypothetical protein
MSQTDSTKSIPGHVTVIVMGLIAMTALAIWVGLGPIGRADSDTA